MADVASPASLYPQPQPPNQGLLGGNPLQIIGAVGQLNQNALFQQEFAARKALGDAYAAGRNPDGSFDLSKISGSLPPSANFILPQAAPAMADLQGKNIINQTAQIQQAASLYGSLANLDKVTPLHVHDMTARIAAMMPGLPPETNNQFAAMILKDPEGLKHGAALVQNIAIGPAGQATRLAGPPDSTGAPQSIPAGTLNLRGGASPIGLPPGEEALLGGGAERAGKLQATAVTSPQYHSDLDNLKQDSRVLENLGGPTFEVEKKLNQLTSRIGGFGVTMTPEQLKAGESFDKIANQISLNQSTLFHGSDAGLHTVVGANPATSMSRYGREGVIDMLQGNQDAIDTTRKAWMDARARGVPANQYDAFIHEFGKTLDPRVFQFNRLSRDNQQKFLSQMEPDDVAEFEQKYKDAIARKWVKPLKAAPNASQ